MSLKVVVVFVTILERIQICDLLRFYLERMNSLIGRNDNCHCGSGKKYKKCCLKKDQAGTVQELKEQHEIARLGESIDLVTKFLTKNVSQVDLKNLTSEYCTIFDSDSNNPILEGIVASYITMVHRFENGMRGIEWYLEETKSTDELLQKIASQPLRTVKIIGTTATTTTVVDLETNETFIVDRETLTMPWGIMQVIILPRTKGNSQFLYKHFPAPPNYLERLKEVPETHLELLKTIFVNHDITFEETSIFEIKGTVVDSKAFIEKMKNDSQVHFDTLDYMHVLEATYQYEDNSFTEPVVIGKKVATVVFKGDSFTALCFDEQNKENFLKWSELHTELTIDKNSVGTSHKTDSEEIENLVILSFGNAKAEHATSIKTRILYQATTPLKTFEQKSLQDVVSAGNIEDAEKFLQKLEYYSYTDYLQFGISTDFNSLRKELGLEASPFVSKVTKDEERVSKITVLNTIVAESSITEKFLAELELPNTIANHVFAEKIASFYFEKTEGKAKSTQQKYKKALFEICSALETATNDIAGLENSINEKATSTEISATQQKNIESIGKTLLKSIS